MNSGKVASVMLVETNMTNLTSNKLDRDFFVASTMYHLLHGLGIGQCSVNARVTPDVECLQQAFNCRNP